MAKTITGGVGRGGRNFPPVDVMTVQYLLNCVPAGQGGPSPELAVDGAAGPKTIAAIEKFQRTLGAICDGRVDPGGATLRALQGRDPYPHQPIAQGGAKGAQGGQPAGKGGPFGKSGGGNQGGFPTGGKAGDPFGKTGGNNQAGYPTGGKGGDPFGKTGGGGQGGFPFGKTGGGNQGGFPPGGKGGGAFPGGKSGGGKGF